MNHIKKFHEDNRNFLAENAWFFEYYVRKLSSKIGANLIWYGTICSSQVGSGEAMFADDDDEVVVEEELVDDEDWEDGEDWDQVPHHSQRSKSKNVWRLSKTSERSTF